MKRLALLLALASLLPGPVHAQGTFFLGHFSLTTPGAAAAGRGRTGVADATDAFAGYWNPAALAFLDGREVVYYYAALMPKLADDTDQQNLGFRYHVPAMGTFGGYALYLDLGKQVGRNEEGDLIDTYHSYLTAYMLSFGIKISTRSSVGFNARITRQHLPDFGPGGEDQEESVSTDYTFDFGYYWQQLFYSRLDLGLSVSNMGTGNEFGDPLPTNLKFGFKGRLVETRNNRLFLLYDMNKLLVASYPNIDHDGDGIIGGYNQSGDAKPGGEYSRNGKWEVAHADPWYLAIFTSWFDDWFYGGDIDRNGNGLIDENEVGSKDDGSLRAELETIQHNIGLEYWLYTNFAVRAGFIYNKVARTTTRTFGVGLRFNGFRADIGYDSSDSTPSHFSLNYAF
jgi:hypothetical protein